MAAEGKPVEVIELKAEIVEADPIASNIAELQHQCIMLAEEYRKVGRIETYEDYQQAKRDRTMFNKAYKHADDERKRVKTVWMGPYTTFEAGVKGALRPLKEVMDRNDAAIKAFEAHAREEKRKRLEGYWEEHYPSLALCTGEADEPLVPFDRIFDPDWTKRLSELNDDRKAEAAMDDVAKRLAAGAQTIADRPEPEHVKRYGLSELYRTLDSDAAQRAMVQEMRRQNDIRALERSPEVPGIPSVEEPPAAPPAPEPEPIAEPAPEPERERRAVYVITIVCDTRAEAKRVKDVMTAAGIKGSIEKKEI